MLVRSKQRLAQLTEDDDYILLEWDVSLRCGCWVSYSTRGWPLAYPASPGNCSECSWAVALPLSSSYLPRCEDKEVAIPHPHVYPRRLHRCSIFSLKPFQVTCLNLCRAQRHGGSSATTDSSTEYRRKHCSHYRLAPTCRKASHAHGIAGLVCSAWSALSSSHADQAVRLLWACDAVGAEQEPSPRQIPSQGTA